MNDWTLTAYRFAFGATVIGFFAYIAQFLP
jgi:hypothetical protein